MKSNKQLDEMQESKLLKIQEKGFWLVFWILFAAIFIQAYKHQREKLDDVEEEGKG